MHFVPGNSNELSPAIDLDTHFAYGATDIVPRILSTPSSAFMHVAPDRRDGRGNFLPLLLAANYTGGHSHGDGKIVVQDVVSHNFPWVIDYKSGSRRFIADTSSFGIHLGKFQDEPMNTLKIQNWYLVHGDPHEIFRSFAKQGYSFNPKHPAVPGFASRFLDLLRR